MKRSAFVITPFTDNSVAQFHRDILRPELCRIGYEAYRADEVRPGEPILERIVQLIEEDDLIICDLTGINPNVMYELGVAHALTRRVLMICNRDVTHPSDIPFDLPHYTVLFYNTRSTPSQIDDFGRRLAEMAEEASHARISNPVQSASRINRMLDVPVIPRRRIRLTENVMSWLVDYVREGAARKQARYVVAISGASCLGKSTLASELSARVKRHGSIGVVRLDGYMMSRADMETRGLSGYSEEANNLPAMKQDLVRLIMTGEAITIPVFDHATGTHQATRIAISPEPIIVLDGVMSLSEAISPLADLRVFLEAKDQWVNKRLRFIVSVERRGRTINNAKLSAEREYTQYLVNVAPFRARAHVVLLVDNDWSLEFL